MAEKRVFSIIDSLKYGEITKKRMRLSRVLANREIPGVGKPWYRKYDAVRYEGFDVLPFRGIMFAYNDFSGLPVIIADTWEGNPLPAGIYGTMSGIGIPAMAKLESYQEYPDDWRRSEDAVKAMEKIERDDMPVAGFVFFGRDPEVMDQVNFMSHPSLDPAFAFDHLKDAITRQAYLNWRLDGTHTFSQARILSEILQKKQ